MAARRVPPLRGRQKPQFLRRTLLLGWCLVFAFGFVASRAPRAESAPTSPSTSQPQSANPPAVTSARSRGEPIVTGEFVRARRGEFVLGDRPFRFLGANIDPLHGDVNRPRYRELIAALAEDGLTVARVWALGEGTEDADSWLRNYQLFRAGPYGFIEDTYIALDHVLAVARLQGVRVMLTLANNWPDYGGAPMYLQWTSAPSWGLHHESFYSHPRTREFYRAGLLKLLTRRNTVTGVKYIDDPTIFAWELMNESTAFSDRGKNARVAWIHEMAALIREYDKNHMITAGVLGYALQQERQEWLRIQQLPEIDFCDSHIYPESLEGFAGGRGEARVLDFLDDRAALCRYVVKKPLVIGEFAYHTDAGKDLYGRPRSTWFSRFLSQHYRNRGSGSFVWLYEPYQLWNGKVRDFAIHIDHPDTDDVRQVLIGLANKLATGGPAAFGPDNPRIVAAQNSGLQTQLLYDPIVVKPGPGQIPHARYVQSDANTALLSIPPAQFAQSAWERSGVWTEGKATHVYGADTGEWTYRFAAPPLLPNQAVTAIDLELRISSEWPVLPAPPEGGSTVEVYIDDSLVGQLVAVADDGSGERRRLQLTDAALRLRLSSGRHSLRFRVPPGRGAHGLCIYGEYLAAPPDNEPAPTGEFSPILLRYHFATIPYFPRASSRRLNATQGDKRP
jgi:mannan endo-1,4-beta-mannosidase